MSTVSVDTVAQLLSEVQRNIFPAQLLHNNIFLLLESKPL
jgi:hypothetical protein